MTHPTRRNRTLPLAMYFLEMNRQLKRGFRRIGIEKRKHPRCTISIRVTTVETGSFSFYHALNISEGGIFLKSIEPLPVGAELRLRFALFPEEGEIEVFGKVVRVQGQTSDNSRIPGMGIKFTRVGPEARQTLEEFMEIKL